MKVEPIIIPATTRRFLEISSVNSRNNKAWLRNHINGKIPSAREDMPKFNNFSL